MAATKKRVHSPEKDSVPPTPVAGALVTSSNMTIGHKEVHVHDEDTSHRDGDRRGTETDLEIVSSQKYLPKTVNVSDIDE